MEMEFKNPQLYKILQAELATGNVVAEVSSWPPKCHKLIILEFKFADHENITELSYLKLNDPHYWYAQYATAHDEEVLACRFKKRPA